jgi:ribonuclease E
MPKRMLIDASHPEETRVVILDGNKVEEFDFESASKRPLKGNIYLAKVTRVEPSLQAAFVEYGGNRQGFLAFSEIHPDYYQIPVADRLALLEAQSERMMAEEEDDGIEAVKTTKSAARDASLSDQPGEGEDAHDDEDESHEEDASEENGHEHGGHSEDDHEHAEANHEHHEHEDGEHSADGEGENGGIETAGSEQSEVQAEAVGAPKQHQRRERKPQRRRHYKIQEVIKRRQIMLVQVVKEERGNKGASLTTFLSLAGRYCVLMPNTPRGGGISRKITSANDRRRLKSAVQSLELPQGMGLIIRTAGANRTKIEIKRDYEYLLRLWDSVRELTLQSNAPALVYEEGNLIKRTIRDLYIKDISEILVDGDAGYRDAKEFMRMLMPSHAKNVKPYKENVPLFQKHHVEMQLDSMFSPVVTLKSGGYIVINQTEALVSIDVNSGKATREHSIEETATKTNLEAADEVARQLRLRDLAGLIVIDFIDMEDSKNDRAVEKRIRDAVSGDRARVQIGKISQFGLLEMSRQRLRAGVVAGSTITCPHCAGMGLIRSVESAALRLLRALEEEGERNRSANILVKAPTDVTIYSLNQKRSEIARIENTYDLVVTFDPQASMMGGSFEIERTGTHIPSAHIKPAISFESTLADSTDADEVEELSEEVDARPETLAEPPSSEEQGSDRSGAERPGEGDGRRKRRRRRGGRGRGRNGANPNGGATPESPAPEQHAEAAASFEDQDEETETAAETETGENATRKRRRRGGRGRRRNGGARPEGAGESASAEAGTPVQADAASQHLAGEEPNRDTAIAEPNAPSSPQWSLDNEAAQTRTEVAATERAPTQSEPQRTAPSAVPAAGESRPQASERPVSGDETEAASDAASEAPSRRGWWQKRFKVGN